MKTLIFPHRKRALNLITLAFWFSISLSLSCSSGSGPNKKAPELKSLSVNITGLTGSTLLLNLAETGEILPAESPGLYTFNKKIAAGNTYTILVSKQPTQPNQRCDIEQSSGIVPNVDFTLSISCKISYAVSIDITGTLSPGLKVSLNEVEDIPINATFSDSTTVTFSHQLLEGENYKLKISELPAHQSCTINGNEGIMPDHDLTGPTLDCTLSAIEPVHPVNGANWNDYTSSILSDTACNPQTNSGCVHGGELRQVLVPGINNCDGLIASDELNAFNWVCSESTGFVTFFSNSLNQGKNLSDLIDFETAAWRENAVTVFSNNTILSKTVKNRWWKNSISLANSPLNTLSNASTIYITTIPIVGGYLINAHSVGIVVKPGLTISGLDKGATVVHSSGQNFSWIEGSMHDNGSVNLIKLEKTNYSKIRNIKNGTNMIRAAPDRGAIFISGSSNIVLKDLLLTGPSIPIIGIVANNSNHIIADNIKLEGFIDLNNSSHWKSNNVRIIRGGIRIKGSSYNIFSNTHISNSIYALELDGFTSPAYNNIFNGTTIHNSEEIVFRVINSNSNIIYNTTLANNWGSMYLTDSDNNKISSLASVNNVMSSLRLERSNLNRISETFTYWVRLFSAFNNVFSGNILFSQPSNNCEVDTSSNGLIVDANTNSCSNDPDISPNAAIVKNLGMPGHFVEKIAKFDPENDSIQNNDGTANAITDQFNFSNAYRAWGPDGLDFPDSTNRRSDPWEVNRIWDWSLRSSSTLAAKTNEPNPDLLVTHIWHAIAEADCLQISGANWSIEKKQCTSTYLANAVEMVNDQIGNDNTLCESGEACVQNTNIGAYQGHGILTEKPFSDGQLTGIKMFQYTETGY